MLPRATPPLLATLALLLLGVCGHPASRDECDLIFNRGAELELRGQNITDPDTIAKRTAELRASKGDEIVNRCVGRRITQREIDCLHAASSSKELDRCFN